MGSILNEDWTADVVGRMHKYRLENFRLAEACGYTAAYLSTVLNGRKQFESEEAKLKTKDRILNALAEIESTIKVEVENDESNSD